MTMAIDRPLVAQFLRFAVVGATTAAIYFVGYVLLRDLDLVGPAVAAVLAYGAAITFQYIGHSNYTFRAREPRRGGLVRFLVLNGVGLALSVLISVGFYAAGWPDWLASTLVVTALPVMNWVVMRLWVFA